MGYLTKMPEFKIVINDSKTGKSYQKVLNDDSLLGKKINDKVDGKLLGLTGYELQITGGTDNAGIPMRQDVDGIARRKILIGKSIGVRKAPKGIRYRKTITGNTVSSRTVQINMAVINPGTGNIEEHLGIKKEEKQEKASS